jgi:hypothetical protein
LGVRSLKNDYIPEQPGAIYDLAFFIHMWQKAAVILPLDSHL